MKRRLLDVGTLGTVLFSTFALFKATVLPAAPAPRQAEVGAADPYATQSAMRYRRCQENHWRACVLQH
jgi:hypothetical protein